MLSIVDRALSLNASPQLLLSEVAKLEAPIKHSKFKTSNRGSHRSRSLASSVGVIWLLAETLFGDRDASFSVRPSHTPPTEVRLEIETRSPPNHAAT